MQSILTNPALLALVVLAAATMPQATTAQVVPDASKTVIGVAAPLAGSPSVLGRQLVDGARAAAAKSGDASDKAIEIVEADTQCSADGGKAAAQRFVHAGVRIVVGFLCTDAIEAALPILKTGNIPTIDVGVRAGRLTDKRVRSGNLIWRIAARSDSEARSIATLLAERWKDEPFGLVDDGSIAARGLSDTVRRLLADKGLKPQSVDNYRPAEEKQFGLVRRLQRTGISRFFIAGDRPDIAIIVREAGEIGLTMQVIGGESLIDEAGDVPLAEGVVAVGPKTRFPDMAGPTRSTDPEATPIEEDAAGPQGYFGPAYAATEIAVAATREAQDAGTGAGDLQAALSGQTFQTALGTVRFDAKGDSNLDLTRIYRWTGERFVPEAGG